MKAASVFAFHADCVVVSGHGGTDESILAHRAVYIHGKSRAQVLGSGGRVDEGTRLARSLDGTDDSGRSTTRTALAVRPKRRGGLKLSSGRASNPGCRGYRLTGIPVRER